MNEKKLSEYYTPAPFKVWDGSETIKIADVVPRDFVVTDVARVMFTDDVDEASYGFRTREGQEFVTSATALSRVAKALIDSDNSDVDSEVSREHVLAYRLLEPVAFRVEKVTTSGGRAFYQVKDTE